MGLLREVLLPEPVRAVPHARAWNIGFRTAHLAAVAALLGGHIHGVEAEHLLTPLAATVVTGAGLLALEVYPSARWFYQGRGLVMLAKLVLVGLVPLLWAYRVPLLLAVLVLASVGSHMPSRYRYFSILHGRVVGGKQEAPGRSEPMRGLILLVGLLGLALVGCRPVQQPTTVAPGPTESLATQPTTPPADKEAQARAPLSGEELYKGNCAGCHGDKGKGDGLAARFLFPRPRDFSEAQFRIATTTNRLPTDDDLFRVITRGMSGSAMVPFGHLSERDRKELVKYVRQLTRAGFEERVVREAKENDLELDKDDLAAAVSAKTEPGELIEFPTEYPRDDAASRARGAEHYKKLCATCHGEKGKGDGAQEQKNNDGMPTRPRDFTLGLLKGGGEPRDLFARIRVGMPGSPMPAVDAATLDNAGAADLVNFVLSFAGPEAGQKYEFRRQTLTARRVQEALGEDIPASVWEGGKPTPIVVGPLWWRDFTQPDLQVQAVHDGKTLAVRMSWLDGSNDASADRVDAFEDMAGLQLFRGEAEPFLGMGAATSALDIWHWRAGAGKPAAPGDSQLDDYPFDTPEYARLLKDKPPPFDPQTARAVGNPQSDPRGPSGNLTAKGLGSLTARPKTSQLTRTRAEWKDGRWTVVFRRPLSVEKDAGLTLEADKQSSIAFAIWDGAARDRNGQKLISVWHDLKVE